VENRPEKVEREYASVPKARGRIESLVPTDGSEYSPDGIMSKWNSEMLKQIEPIN
jgi:hypothetical protein